MELTEKQRRKLQNAADITDIQMLMARYIQFMDQMNPLGAYNDLFVTDDPQVTVEINECGGYVGPEHARAFMERYDRYMKNPADKRGWMDVQELTTPYVIISRDETTARGQWSVFNPQARQAMTYPNSERKLTAIWSFAKYTAEFVRTPDGWKFRKLRQITYVRAPFEEGWNKQAECYRMPAELYYAPDTPSRSSIYHQDCIYSGHGIYNWGPYLPDEEF